MLSLHETIRPSADLRNHYNEISKQYTAQDFLELPDVYMKFDTYLSIYNKDVNNNHATFWAFLKDLYIK